VVARACVQSITIDEADTYLAWVAGPAPTHWAAASNNHILNSMLMRLFTTLFGVGHLSARAPALIGAAIYIAAAYWLCRLVTQELSLQWTLLICLVYNPFVMDYLVAARGYSLALALLMSAIALAAYNRNESTRTYILISLCAALSFSANFSFAFADLSAVLFIALWGCWHARTSIRKAVRIAIACTVPGLLVALFLTGSVLAQWSRSDITYGAPSLRQTRDTVIQASLYELNPHLVNPLLYGFLVRVRPLLFPLLGAACLLQLIAIPWNRRSLNESCRRLPGGLGALCAGVMAVPLALHWILFRLIHLPYPQDRTALYFAPLSFLLVGALAAFPLSSRLGVVSRWAVAVMLFATASWFLMCLRLTYFKEWKYDADVKDVYSVLSYYNHTYGLTDIQPEWRYVAALNFYRAASGHETIPEFDEGAPPYLSGKKAYVMYYQDDYALLEKSGLKVVYRGALSDVVVAIRPEVETTGRRASD
jgi:4-amino-4-deoxy-L-arabinose transferase-like glycosyltransferase